jgi:HSP20 family molecular chaperone IbpA
MSRVASYVEGVTYHQSRSPGVEPTEIELTVKRTAHPLRRTQAFARNQEHVAAFDGMLLVVGDQVAQAVLARNVGFELQARFANGVLEITAPLPAARLPKKVPVQIAQTAREVPQTISA